MKKILFILMIFINFAGCSKKTAGKGKYVGMANPVKEVTAAELNGSTGFSFNIPQGAEEVHFYRIADKVAQMTFVWSGCDCTARIKASESGEPEDISGFYYNWESISDLKLGKCSAVVKYLTTEKGNVVVVCSWADNAEGTDCSMSMDIPGLGPGDVSDLRRVCLELAKQTFYDDAYVDVE